MLSAVDPIAWAQGLRPGQALAQAQACWPDLEVADADPAGDGAALAALAAWCLRYAPVVQPDPPDGILLDVEGAAHLMGGNAALLADLLERLHRAGFGAECALAPGAAAAWALARHRPGAIVPPGGEGEALAAVPVVGLRLPRETCRALDLLGIRRIGDLADFPRAQLALRFGPGLLRRLDRAMGREPDPLSPLVPSETPEARLAFAEPIAHLDGLAAACSRLAPVLCRALERRRVGLRRLDALFRRVDGCPLAIRVGTAAPSRDPVHLVRLLAERLPTIDPGFGIDEIALVATRVEASDPSQVDAVAALDPSAEPGSAALAPLVDRLGARLGPTRIYRLQPVESRHPERSVRRVPALSPATRTSWPAQLPRPSRLVDPPEEVSAIAVVPDDPPASFVWRKVRHVVRAADGPERVHGEWWRRDEEEASLRDYYRVEDTRGRRFWLFRDAPMVESGRWWLHGRFA